MVVVPVDPETGDVDTVLYSGYHHLVSVINDGVTLSTGVTGDPTHANLRIDRDYHHYYNTSQEDGVLLSEQSGVEFDSWLDERDTWYDHGVYNSSSPAAVDDPYTLLDGERDTWWADGEPDKALAKLWVTFGLRNADDADPVRAEGWF
jgi:hypothetical protein